MVYLPSLDLFCGKLSDQHMLPPIFYYFSMFWIPFAKILAHIAPQY